jgi:hydroxypyruvate reductase
VCKRGSVITIAFAPSNENACDTIELVAHRVRQWTQIARHAIDACDGGALVAQALAGPHWRYAWVWAVGKAAAAMAHEFGGALVVDTRVAAHPIPDERSVEAAERLLEEARAVPEHERALLLLSGGASSLVAAPVAELTLAELQEATRMLLRSGAPIREINVVRRHLTRLGGGKLAAACAGAIDVFAISDVAGDDPATIGSGPASPDPASRAEAIAIARRLQLPAAALRALERGGENPRADDPRFARASYHVLASPETLRDEAARAVHAAGLSPRVRAELVAGDVEDFAVELHEVAATLAHGECFVAVGEPTVHVRGAGVGGRAQHLALTLSAPLAGRDLALVAVGSDGRDGPTDAAGAFVDGRTLAACARAGIDVADALARCDSHRALAAVGATVAAWPTGTNLTDLYLLGRA